MGHSGNQQHQENHFPHGVIESHLKWDEKLKIKNPGYFSITGVLNGRVGGIRTRDPLVPNQMRYQLRYDSKLENL